MKNVALIIAFFGILSFIAGIVAEIKKPAGGIRLEKRGYVLCKYESDPMLLWGYLSIGFLAASSLFGMFSPFLPFKGKHVSRKILFRSGAFSTFFNIALLTTGVAATLLIWPTLTERFHITNNVHHNLETDCPTAKTGLLGGGSFVSLDAMLLWLITLMLAGNAREDYIEYGDNKDDGNKGENGSSTTVANA